MLSCCPPALNSPPDLILLWLLWFCARFGFLFPSPSTFVPFWHIVANLFNVLASVVGLIVMLNFNYNAAEKFCTAGKATRPCCSASLLPLPAQLNFKYFATVNVNWKICASKKLA